MKSVAPGENVPRYFERRTTPSFTNLPDDGRRRRPKGDGARETLIQVWAGGGVFEILSGATRAIDEVGGQHQRLWHVCACRSPR